MTIFDCSLWEWSYTLHLHQLWKTSEKWVLFLPIFRWGRWGLARSHCFCSNEHLTEPGFKSRFCGHRNKPSHKPRKMSGNELAGNPARAVTAVSRTPIAKLHLNGVVAISRTPSPLPWKGMSHSKGWESQKPMPPMKVSCPGSSWESFWNYFHFAPEI